MSWLQVVVLSVVQGLTEFLPVSSTGHLILAGSQLNFVGEPSTAMFRRADVNPDDMFVFRGARYGTLVDMVLWIKLLARGRCHYVTEPLSSYRQHDNQLGVASGSQIADRLEWMPLLLDAPLLGYLQDPDQEARALHHRVLDTMNQGVVDPGTGQQLLLQHVTRLIDRLATQGLLETVEASVGRYQETRRFYRLSKLGTRVVEAEARRLESQVKAARARRVLKRV